MGRRKRDSLKPAAKGTGEATRQGNSPPEPEAGPPGARQDEEGQGQSDLCRRDGVGRHVQAGEERPRRPRAERFQAPVQRLETAFESKTRVVGANGGGHRIGGPFVHGHGEEKDNPLLT